MTTSGPFSTYTSLPGMGSTRKTWYRQSAPYKHPLPYNLDKMYAVEGVQWTSPLDWAADVFTDTGDHAWDRLNNRARDKIRAQIQGSSAAWGANLATWKQSHGMIVARATQLLSAVVLLKRGRFKAAAKQLGISKIRKRHARDLAGQWLELSYGWIPLISDIYASVDVLQQPLPKIELRARASLGKTTPWQANMYQSYQWERKVTIGCRINAIHNGALLANSLGLVNPATVLWEIVPFSFVVDWFLPVGTFLQSFTDFVGVDIDDTYWTQYGRVDRFFHRTDRPADDHSACRVQMVRVLELPPYKLIPRFTGFYSMRGANAIALLVGGLKSLK